MGDNVKKKKFIHKSHKYHSKLKWLIIVALVIIISVGGVFAYYKFFSNKTNTLPSTNELSSTEKASQLATSGDYIAGQKILDEELSKQTDDVGKIDAYVNKAILATNNEKYDDAITFANKADNLSQNRMTSRLLAQIYAKMGDTAKALEYYQLTISRYSENDKISDDEAQNYYDDMQKIQELSQ